MGSPLPPAGRLAPRAENPRRQQGDGVPIADRGRLRVFGGMDRYNIVSDGSAKLTVRSSSATRMTHQLSVPFVALGSSVIFSVQLPEPTPSGVPDEMAFFYLADSVTAAFPTADPLGTSALFAIDVTGQSGGDLSVFPPMQFVPPDTLRMVNSTTGVQHDELKDRLRFRSVTPNPPLGRVRFLYDVPAPGGMLQVKLFDVAGRLVAQPFKGKQTPGTWGTSWDASGAGGRVLPSGVYIVQLQMAGQSIVWRVVLTR